MAKAKSDAGKKIDAMRARIAERKAPAKMTMAELQGQVALAQAFRYIEEITSSELANEEDMQGLRKALEKGEAVIIGRAPGSSFGARGEHIWVGHY